MCVSRLLAHARNFPAIGTLGVGWVGREPTCAQTPKGKSFVPPQDWSLYRNRKFVARKTTTLSFKVLGILQKAVTKTMILEI